MLENLLLVIGYNFLETCRLQSKWFHNSRNCIHNSHNGIDNSHNGIHNSHNGIDKLAHPGFPVVASDAGKSTCSNLLFSLAT